MRATTRDCVPLTLVRFARCQVKNNQLVGRESQHIHDQRKKDEECQ